MTGPEGGFSEEEVALAAENNMKICSLGPRILRCETAPLCALTAVLYASGALDRSADEKTELAQYEWIKVYGVLFGCEEKMDKMFEEAVDEAGVQENQ